MVRLAISVEGSTEREFTKQVLGPHLLNQQIYITPIDIVGNVSLPRIVHELKKIVHNFDFTTTLYDLYGFKGRGGKDADTLQQEIIHQMNGDNRIIPYIQQYEFEALVFSSPNVVSEVLGNSQLENHINQILTGLGGPEEINDGYETCPSRRLKNLHPTYDKVLHGPQITLEAGLEAIRASCPRFHQWIIQLENLGN
jgi:hypothetical protein